MKEKFDRIYSFGHYLDEWSWNEHPKEPRMKKLWYSQTKYERIEAEEVFSDCSNCSIKGIKYIVCEIRSIKLYEVINAQK